MPNNRPTTQENVVFASEKESQRYQELLLLLQSGQITDLVIHPKYPLVVNGQLIGHYYGDFQYDWVATGEPILEDVKHPPSWEKKLVAALYEIDIVEV